MSRVSKNYRCERCGYESPRAFLECPQCKPADSMSVWFKDKRKDDNLLGY